ncbi:MAG TPA: hypothetical protein VM345_02560 [Acidimicrobiales bacterium]|nr:hypothetical protein [Acidimicrobiales bacterium]
MTRRRLVPILALVALLVGFSALKPSESPVRLGGVAPAAAYPLGDGYWLAAQDGGIFSFGDAQFFGSTGALNLKAPIVGAAAHPFLEGYWLVASDGGIFAFGSSAFWGSLGDKRLNSPIVGMASTPTGLGYWLVAADGGVFAFGDAQFFGSAGNLRLNRPIVGIAATPSGKGYWLVATDGGIFNYGDAAFLGSQGGRPLNRPIVGIASTPSGGGYYMVASDGGVFTHGDAVFRGSRGGQPLNAPIVGMAVSPDGGGYQFVATDGGIFNYGDSKFFGSTGGQKLNKPILGMAIRPRLGVIADAFAPTAGQTSEWVQVGNDWRLRLNYRPATSSAVPAGARIYGVEGLDVDQLGTLEYVIDSGACDSQLRFQLFYDANRDGRQDGTVIMACSGAATGLKQFNPVGAGAPAKAIVTALDLYYGPLAGGTVEIDDLKIAGIAVPDYLTHRLK